MITLDTVATGEAIKKKMTERNFKPDTLAKELLVSRATVYYWITGEKMPTLDKVFMLTDVLNCKAEDIIRTKRVEV